MVNNYVEVSEKVKTISLENNSIEELMLINLNKALNSETVIEMLKRNWNKFHDIHHISNLIGEIYNLHVINKDGYGFKYYMDEIEKLYTKYKNKQISPENFNMEKAKLISIVIASKIGVDVNKEVTQNDLIRIKDYFLHEYVENGYVTHSFPEAYFDKIVKDGLFGITKERSDKLEDLQEIQEIFMNKGVVAPLGGYPYYEGSGIYFENDFTKTFQHSVDSPEWFAWFTSSNHTHAYQNDISVVPYVLRDEEHCRRNVMDLCENADLTSEEAQKVLYFYEKNYIKYSSPKLNVALIPKKVLGKSDISKALPNDMNLLDSITYVLNDGAKEYVEHKGNVYEGNISSDNFLITVIPDASKYINATEYLRETKKHLTDLQTNSSILLRAQDNKSRMSTSTQEKIKIALLKLEKLHSFEINDDTKNNLREELKKLKQDLLSQEEKEFIEDEISKISK